MQPSTAIAETDFRTEASGVLGEVQDAIRRLLGEVGSTGSPRELQRTLGVEYRLAWRATRIAAAPEPLAAGPHVPATASVKKLVRAAQANGAGETAASAVLAAEERFRQLVERHAPERGFFDTMACALAADGAGTLDPDLKRAAFRANCQIHGRMVDAAFSTTVVAPGHSPGHMDLLNLRGMTGYQRLRPETALRITGARLDDADPHTTEGPSELPASLATPIGMRMYLLRPFSAPGMPPFQIVDREDGFRDVYLRTTDVGSTASLDFAIARFDRDASAESAEGGFRYTLQTETRTPTRHFVQDILVHHSVYDGQAVRTATYERPPGPTSSASTYAKLPTGEPGALVGRGRRAAHCAEIPKYVEMLALVAREMEWDLEEFNLFRYRVEFPILNSLTQLIIG